MDSKLSFESHQLRIKLKQQSTLNQLSEMD